MLFILEGLECHPFATVPPKICSITGVSPVCQLIDAKHQISDISITLFILKKKKSYFSFGLLLLSSTVKSQFSQVSYLFLNEAFKIQILYMR